MFLTIKNILIIIVVKIGPSKITINNEREPMTV